MIRDILKVIIGFVAFFVVVGVINNRPMRWQSWVSAVIILAACVFFFGLAQGGY